MNVEFPSNYPFQPPEINFVTPIYHPNISDDGAICVSILKTSEWSSALTISKTILSISSLLNEPNPHDPLRRDAADMFINNREEFNKIAKEKTQYYAYAIRQSNN